VGVVTASRRIGGCFAVLYRQLTKGRCDHRHPWTRNIWRDGVLYADPTATLSLRSQPSFGVAHRPSSCVPGRWRPPFFYGVEAR
jgi:hypothetical protein